MGHRLTPSNRAIVQSMALAAGLLLPSLRVAAQEPAPQPAPAEVPVVNEWRFEWDDHPSLRYGDATRLDFRARLQADIRKSDAPVGNPSAFDVARKRVGIDGRVGNLVDFQIEAELGNDEFWRDVYVDYRQFPATQVQAGKFKVPFSLDENRSSTELDFIYRSLAASQLAPGRDRGVMVHGRIVNGVVRYELGLFNHDGRNARTSDPDRSVGTRTTAGRFAVQPFRNTGSAFRNLHVAIAFTQGDVPQGLSVLRGRTALDASFFPADIWVLGRRRRTGFEAEWQPGPFSIAGEYIRAATERRGQSVDDTDLSPLVGTGWYVSGSWVVTGQPKSGDLDRPISSILGGGVGAVEVAIRVETLEFSSAGPGGTPSTSPRADVVLGNRDRVMTVGANWYPVRGAKLQGNLIREEMSIPGLGPTPSQPTFWSTVFRLQLTL